MHGRPSVLYSRNHCGALIALAAEGGDLERFAMQLGVPLRIVRVWRRERPEFAEAVRIAAALGKACADRKADIRLRRTPAGRAKLHARANGLWPYTSTRAMPEDFPEVYVLLGCKETELYYGTNGRAIQRWLREFGEAELVQLRRGYLRKLAASRGQPSLIGRRADIRGGEFSEASAGDPSLAWMPVRRVQRPYREEVWVPIRGRPKPELCEE